MSTLVQSQSPKSIRVVKTVNGQLYREILNENQYTKNTAGQIILPDGYYSAGYAERICDGFEWDKLPLFSQPREEHIPMSRPKVIVGPWTPAVIAPST
jgi:hypothetical protein